MSVEALKIKVVMIGDSGVGKTSLAGRFTNKNFRLESSTVMVDYHQATIFHGQQEINFLIWDTAGQDRFKSVVPLYYRDAEVAIIVYDITSEKSFVNARRWYEQLTSSPAANVKVVSLCGNKIDLNDREVTSADGSKMASDLGMIFSECSALSGKNTDELLTNIANALMRRRWSCDSGFERESQMHDSVINLEDADIKPRKKRKFKISKCTG